MGINVYHSLGRTIYLYYQLQVEAIVFEYTNLCKSYRNTQISLHCVIQKNHNV